MQATICTHTFALMSHCDSVAPAIVCHCTCAQELLLILEEHWERNPALHSVPIYQASGLAQKAMTVYQTYIEMMNDAIKAAFQAGALCPWAALAPGPKRTRAAALQSQE